MVTSKVIFIFSAQWSFDTITSLLLTQANCRVLASLRPQVFELLSCQVIESLSCRRVVSQVAYRVSPAKQRDRAIVSSCRVLASLRRSSSCRVVKSLSCLLGLWVVESSSSRQSSCLLCLSCQTAEPRDRTPASSCRVLASSSLQVVELLRVVESLNRWVVESLSCCWVVVNLLLSCCWVVSRVPYCVSPAK